MSNAENNVLILATTCATALGTFSFVSVVISAEITFTSAAIIYWSTLALSCSNTGLKNATV